MIYVTRLDGSQLVINMDLIETVERTANTVITMSNGRQYVVVESPDEVVYRAGCFRRLLIGEALSPTERAVLSGEKDAPQMSLLPFRRDHTIRESE